MGSLLLPRSTNSIKKSGFFYFLMPRPVHHWQSFIQQITPLWSSAPSSSFPSYPLSSAPPFPILSPSFSPSLSSCASFSILLFFSPHLRPVYLFTPLSLTSSLCTCYSVLLHIGLHTPSLSLPQSPSLLPSSSISLFFLSLLMTYTDLIAQ